jgi:hypothetical protein
MVMILASVGRKGRNRPEDVRVVQALLNQNLPIPLAGLALDGVAGPLTVSAIQEYQRRAVGMSRPDGLVEPGGPTYQALLAGKSPNGASLQPTPAAATAPPATPPSAATLEEHLNALGLRHFRGEEVAALASRTAKNHDTGETVTNGEPPRALWDNIIPTLIVVDELRERLGYGLTLNSVYRSPAYNQALKSKNGKASGVALKSQHQAFRAIDFHGSQGSPGAWVSELKKMRGQRFPLPRPVSLTEVTIPGIGHIPLQRASLDLTDHDFEFHGGMKAYVGEHFVHVDSRGTDDNWG